MRMTKVITLSDEAYSTLKRMKNGKSFSKVILSLTANRKEEHLLDILKRMGKNTELADAVESVYKERGKAKLKEVSF